MDKIARQYFVELQYVLQTAVGNIYVGESCGSIRKVNQTGFVSTVQNADSR
jgi:hypothetical protein